MSDIRLLSTYSEFEYSPETIKESLEKNDGKIMMKGILQKADTLNQNGRVYPANILEREIRNYQKFILENRSLGELDHPDCVPHDDQILTISGWKQIGEIADDEIIATLNTKTNEIEYQRITEKIDQQYKGEMYVFKNARTYDMCLTPNHRILAWDRSQKPYFITAKEAYDLKQKNDSGLSHSGLRRSGVWKGEDPEFVEIAGKQIDSSLWAAFLGIYLAEGHATGILSEKKTRKSEQSICVTQYKSESREAIKQMMMQLPWEIKEIPQGFTIQDEKLYDHLYELGSSHNKHMPKYAKGWSSRLLETMLEWMLLGDGRNRYGYKKECIVPEYATTSKQLADDVYEIMLKLGSGATIHTYQPEDRPAPDYETTNRMILSENSALMHIVYQHSSTGMSLDTRFMKAEKIDYEGRVCCVKVPNGTWLMRHNGKSCWTGNSSVVNLKNVSHVIREAYIENGTVYGTLEVLHKTPSGAILKGLVESGLKLGISSRGVGSTQKKGDYHVVQDDFQLICWDVVSEPSTPSAFILPEGKKINDFDPNKFLTKSDRIDRILNEILK
jgi:hypothetical protein